MLIGIVDSETKYVALIGVGFDKSTVGMIVGRVEGFYLVLFMDSCDGRVERILPEELVPVNTDIVADLMVQDVLSDGPC